MAIYETEILNKLDGIQNGVGFSKEQRDALLLLSLATPLFKRMINRDAGKMTLFDKVNNAYRPQNVSDLTFTNDGGIIKMDASSKAFSNYTNNIHTGININSSDEDKTPPITLDFRYNVAAISRNTIFVNNQLIEINVKLQNKILEIRNIPVDLIDYFLTTCTPQLIAQ